jgi:hypothetical protein
VSKYFFTRKLSLAAKAPATAGPNLNLEDAILDRMQVRIPPGHVGLTGIAIYSSGTQVWPTGQGTWTIGDNELIDWLPALEVTQHGLQPVGYNNDKYPHTFYLRFWLTDKPPAVAAAIIAAPQLTPVKPATASTVGNLAGALTAADLAALARQQQQLTGAPAGAAAGAP